MSTTATQEPLLASVARTCELLGGISLSTLDRLVERGVIEPVRFTPKAHRRFRIADINRLAQLDERLKRPATKATLLPVAPPRRSKRERVALIERAPAELDWDRLGPEERWTALNLGVSLANGHTQAELGRFYGLTKTQISRRMAALRRAIEAQLDAEGG